MSCSLAPLLELPLETLDFVFGQQAPLPARESFVLEESNPDAAQLFHGMPYCLKHSADLLIPSLVQRHFEPWIRSRLQWLDLAWRQPLVVDEHPVPHAVQFASGSPATFT